MYAALRGNAARLDDGPRCRFGPAGRGSNVLKTTTLHTQYDLRSREFSCIKMFQRVGFTQVTVQRTVGRMPDQPDASPAPAPGRYRSSCPPIFGKTHESGRGGESILPGSSSIATINRSEPVIKSTRGERTDGRPQLCRWLRFAILASRSRRRRNRHSLTLALFRNSRLIVEAAAQPAHLAGGFVLRVLPLLHLTTDHRTARSMLGSFSTHCAVSSRSELRIGHEFLNLRGFNRGSPSAGFRTKAPCGMS